MAWNNYPRKPKKWTIQPDNNIGSCGLDLDEEMSHELPVFNPLRPPDPPAPYRPGATPAASNVLQEPCLLEMILIELDMKTLLLAQRVSSFWHATITDSSTKLQKKLFFKPATIDDLIPLRMAGPPGSEEHGADFVVPPEEESTQCQPNDFVQINHLLDTVPLQHARDYNHCWVRLRLPEGLDPTQSWNRMYASQPPVRLKTIREVILEREAYESATGKVWVTPGIECKMHVWIKGYAVTVDKFWVAMERRKKEKKDMAAEGKDWKPENQNMVLQRRAKVFNRVPHNYTLCT